MTTRETIFVGAALACALCACGSRPSYWDTGVAAGTVSLGLSKGVALVDDADHRVVFLTAAADQTLSKLALPVGHNVVSQATTTSPDGSRLFVLSAGDTPRRTAKDQLPELTVIDASTFDLGVPKTYPTSVALPSLAIDPLGDWAVAYTGPGAPASFVENPNEIVIFDLKAPPSKTNPVTHTIRSQGGTPQRLTFTPEMNLPRAQGSKRLLIVETDVDVTLLELSNPSSDVTVSLTSGTNAQQVTPAGAIVDSGLDPKTGTALGPPRIALRANDNRNVFTFTLAASDTNDFNPVINVIDVGGTPSDIAFVRADQNVLRVAALVPTLQSAVLVDSDTSITTQVALPAAYSRLSLVTNVVGSSTGTDVAMLWSGSAAGVALWSLGNTVGQPYHSIEVLPIAQQVQTVDDVSQQAQLKVLETETANVSSESGFLVLDLIKRTAAPLRTMGRATLAIAPDGMRMWAFAQGGTALAKLDFVGADALNPVPLTTDKAIDAVYDVARADGGRSLIAIHNEGTVGATVFDALAPDTATARIVPALLLEGP